MTHLSFQSIVGLATLALVGAQSATAGDPVPVLSLSTTQIYAEPGQTIDVIAISPAPASGVMLGLEIGNQNLIVDEPVFTSVDFSPSPFDDVAHTEGNTGPEPSHPNFIDAWILTNNPSDEYVLNEVIATLVIDGSGFAAGQEFPLYWSWSAVGVGSADSSVILSNQPVVINQTPAVLRIVPEPATLGLACLGGLMLVTPKRKSHHH